MEKVGNQYGVRHASAGSVVCLLLAGPNLRIVPPRGPRPHAAQGAGKKTVHDDERINQDSSPRSECSAPNLAISPCQALMLMAFPTEAENVMS